MQGEKKGEDRLEKERKKEVGETDRHIRKARWRKKDRDIEEGKKLVVEGERSPEGPRGSANGESWEDLVPWGLWFHGGFGWSGFGSRSTPSHDERLLARRTLLTALARELGADSYWQKHPEKAPGFPLPARWKQRWEFHQRGESRSKKSVPQLSPTGTP